MDKSGAATSSVATTLWGLDFDTLCQGLGKGYSYNLLDLANVTENTDDNPSWCLGTLINALISHINSTVHELEFHSHKILENICIGKTFVKMHKRKDFNHMDPNTWVKKGISARWSQKYKPNYDGLVVLTCVTRSMVDIQKEEYGRDLIALDQQDLALMLEQGLINHFTCTPQVNNHDIKVNNELFSVGKRGTTYIGFVVYLAFQYEHTENINTDLEDNEHGSSVESGSGTDNDRASRSCNSSRSRSRSRTSSSSSRSSRSSSSRQ